MCLWQFWRWSLILTGWHTFFFLLFFCYWKTTISPLCALFYFEEQIYSIILFSDFFCSKNRPVLINSCIKAQLLCLILPSAWEGKISRGCSDICIQCYIQKPGRIGQNVFENTLPAALLDIFNWLIGLWMLTLKLHVAFCTPRISCKDEFGGDIIRKSQQSHTCQNKHQAKIAMFPAWLFIQSQDLHSLSNPPECLWFLHICIGSPTDNTHQSPTWNSLHWVTHQLYMSHFCAVWMEHLLSWLVNSLKPTCSSVDTSTAWQFGHGNFTLFIQQWN